MLNINKMISTTEFTHWLEQFINFERNPKKDLLNLEKMFYFAQYFGNPQNSYKTIHVAGSKGKGSVSTMISFCLTESGFKTGLYTSPHVLDFRERISLSGTFFSDEAYSKAYTEIMEGFEKILSDNPDCDPTWFEVVTILSFVLFKNEKVDYAVFEVGMGGRLDTTNIIQPEVCAIMPIELEHCKYLGDTIAKIAFEKAGIIKNGVPFFCFEQQEEALKVFRSTSEKRNAKMFYMPQIIKDIKYNVSLDGLETTIEFKDTTEIGKLFSSPLHAKLKLLDEVQAKNAALVLALVKYIDPTIKDQILERGVTKTKLLGRFEILKRQPLVVADGAHTSSSLRFLVSTFKKIATGKSILIFACAEDKNTDDFPQIFEKSFDKIYLTIPGNFKKSDLGKLQKSFTQYFEDKPNKVEVSENFKSVIKKAYNESLQTNKPLLITGSFYLVGEAKNLL